ncbi:MAG: pentapeptide repeat-containing protein [Gammaproteobacteria bacterium]|nr:MAG: pentapeptide repeat-containing protein [Gammaproteobacteria bacterium]
MNMRQTRQVRGGAREGNVCHLWYMQNGGRVRGPFPAGVIGRYILRGELTAEDVLSRDKKQWSQVRELAQFAQLLLRPASDLPQPSARLQVLLNTAYGRHAPLLSHAGTQAEAAPLVRHSTAPPRERVWPQLLMGVAILSAVVWLAIRYSAPLDTVEIQCDAAAAAGVNWDGCHKEGAQLAGAALDYATLNNTYLQQASLRAARMQNATLIFAQLSGADLSYADLRGASLLGAQMQGANLSSANLQGADLSYADLSGAGLGGADLTGAKLDHVIWWDGGVCAAGSVGECLASSP